MSIRKLIKSIDIVSPNIAFNFFGNERYKSIFGGILTTSLILTVMLLALIWSIPIFEYQNPQTSLSQAIDQHISINLSSLNYSLAFVIIDSQGNLLKNQELYFEAFAYSFTLKSNQTSFQYSTTYKKVNLSQCTNDIIESNFPELNRTVKSLLNPSILNKSFCLPAIDNPNYYLQNSFGTNNSTFVSIYLSQCNNLTMNYTCKNESEIRNTIGKYYIYTLLPDIFFDHNQHNPSLKRISYKPHSLSGQLNKRLFYNYKIVNYQSDFNYFYDNFTEENYYQIQSFNYDFNSIDSRLIFPNAFFEMTLTIESQVSDKYKRTFTKIPQLLANIGGLFNFIYLALFTLSEFLTIKVIHQRVFDACVDYHVLKEIMPGIFGTRGAVKSDLNMDKNLKTSEKLFVKTNIDETKNRSSESIKNIQLKENSNFIDIIRDYSEEIFVIFKIKNHNYYKTLFPCLRKYSDKDKLMISEYFYQSFFDIRFLFRNILELLIHKESSKNN